MCIWFRWYNTWLVVSNLYVLLVGDDDELNIEHSNKIYLLSTCIQPFTYNLSKVVMECMFFVQNGELMLPGINVFLLLLLFVMLIMMRVNIFEVKKWYKKRIGKGRFRMFPDNDQSATLEQKKCNVTNCRCCWLKIMVLLYV